MILEIDAGNTRTKWRIRDHQRIVARGGQDTDTVSKNFEAELDPGMNLTEARLCCVTDPLVRNSLIDQLGNRFGIQTKIAKVSSRAGQVVNGYKDFKNLGVDRWLAIVAAYQRIAGAVVVVDAGTAITIDLVGCDGIHQGGYIVPGLAMMRNALTHGTSGIKLGPLEQTDGNIGPLDTYDAVSQGCLLSAIALVEYFRKDIDSTLVLTGGDAQLIHAHLNVECICVQDLVLEGLSVTGITLA